MTQTPPATPGRTAATPPETSVKETLISLIIAFVMAMVFRSYVVEAFIIPTGSMAPTLMGAHMRFKSPETGYEWSVNPWYYQAGSENPLGIQGQGEHGAPNVTDPMTLSVPNPLPLGGRDSTARGFVLPGQVMPLSAGDRILVQKYLYQLFPPKRYDVVVFKNPEQSSQNFIKRLVGLPNEDLWIAAGDIFARPRGSGDDAWKIQRKPHRVQAALWRPIFASQYTPLNPVRDGRPWFRSPWNGEGWETKDNSFRWNSAEAGTLAWDHVAWPITCWEPYNDFPGKLRANAYPVQLFPVPDLRVRAAVTPDGSGVTIVARIESQGQEYEALFGAGTATLRMRDAAPGSEAGLEWTQLATGPAPALKPGASTMIEFWHADQALELRVGDKTVLKGTYEWGPRQRLLRATGMSTEAFDALPLYRSPLADADEYVPSRPKVSITVRGGPVTLRRVELDRDVYYQAVTFENGSPGLGTHPDKLVQLKDDQFFVLGDNSASSKDGRLWNTIDPWVADQIDPTIGVVPRDLVLGKAFFVYFPSPFSAFGVVPVPDIGRVRPIR